MLSVLDYDISDYFEFVPINMIIMGHLLLGQIRNLDLD